MFQSVKTVAYRVPDLEAAKTWYRAFLGKDPIFDSPMAAVFAIGDTTMVLAPGGEGAVVYWRVDDIDAAYKRALDSGASSRSEIALSAFRSRIASVCDPFGNVIGLSGSLESARDKSVEDRPSDSAMSVAVCRALGALDPREEVRGADRLAEIFLVADMQKALAQPRSREYLIKQFAITGTYEFFLARTAYFDAVVQRALAEEIPQIVFLGAGYDSRPYRFRDAIRSTRIFELDSRPTQERKRRLLAEANIAAPPQVSFVPVNFLRDSLEDVLKTAGFDPGARTLFIWEGVTYYLPQEAVDNTLSFVRMNSAPGSAICFDYLMDAPDIMERHGVMQALTSMRSVYKGEPIQFRIPEASIESFLTERGFSLCEHLTPADMEKRFLTLKTGEPAGRALACFAFALAASYGAASNTRRE